MHYIIYVRVSHIYLNLYCDIFLVLHFQKLIPAEMCDPFVRFFNIFCTILSMKVTKERLEFLQLMTEDISLEDKILR